MNLNAEAKICPECYADNSRVTPLLRPKECLENHTQYICGTCGRCICIGHDPKRNLQRWNFPFKTAETARLYLRTADHCMKKSCGIYEIKSKSGRISYKIFPDTDELNKYLEKNRDKSCENMSPVFAAAGFEEFPETKVRKLTKAEAEKYLGERS